MLQPWQRTEVLGWRKSEQEVAAFEFTALADSYAARTGRPQDVGVIGVAVFREAPSLEVSQSGPQGVAVPAPSSNVAPGADTRRAEGATAGSAQAPAVRERLGTGHGDRETSVAHVTTFERASARPDQRLEIRYDSLENLVAAGIVPPPNVAGTSPRAFPADPRPYVPDPPAR